MQTLIKKIASCLTTAYDHKIIHLLLPFIALRRKDKGFYIILQIHLAFFFYFITNRPFFPIKKNHKSENKHVNKHFEDFFNPYSRIMYQISENDQDSCPSYHPFDAWIGYYAWQSKQLRQQIIRKIDK